MKISLSRHAIAKNKETRREAGSSEWVDISLLLHLHRHRLAPMQLYTSGSLTEESAGIRSGSSESEWGSPGSSECVVGVVRWGCLHRHRLDSYVQYANRYEGNYLMKARPSPGCREKNGTDDTHIHMQQWLQYVYCRRCLVSLLPASTYQNGSSWDTACYIESFYTEERRNATHVQYIVPNAKCSKPPPIDA